MPNPNNNVLLEKIERPVWYTMYHHLPVVKGVSSSPAINLVGGIPTPLKNMSSSVGMIIPNWMESHKIHVPVTTNQNSIYTCIYNNHIYIYILYKYIYPMNPKNHHFCSKPPTS